MSDEEVVTSRRRRGPRWWVYVLVLLSIGTVMQVWSVSNQQRENSRRVDGLYTALVQEQNDKTAQGDKPVAPPAAAIVENPDVVANPVEVSEGPQGIPGIQGIQGRQGIQGIPGSSAYQIAVAQGFNGDVDAWLASLVGEEGPPGQNGQNGNDGQNGTNGQDGADSTVPGPPGPPGQNGADSTVPGPPGEKGDKGDTGDPGPTCPDGYSGGEYTVLTTGSGGLPESRTVFLCAAN